MNRRYRKTIIAGNWKMNKTVSEMKTYAEEIRGIMLRENNYVAILGVLIGIPPGVWLTGVIMKMCEYESMVFVTRVSWSSILAACVITYAFSFFIQGLLTRKVRTIDMVEALKSVE